MTLLPTRASVASLRLTRARSVMDAGLWNMIAAQIEQADARNVKSGDEPRLSSLLLQAPSGEAFRLSVSDLGVLVVTPVPRT